jgi:hypothetical protein
MSESFQIAAIVILIFKFNAIAIKRGLAPVGGGRSEKGAGGWISCK